MKMLRMISLLGCLLLLTICLGVPSALAVNKVLSLDSVVIPYLDTGYKFKVVSFDEGPGFEQIDFDDSEFSTGDAGFGTPSGDCLLNNPMDVKTTWPLRTDILLRKQFNLPARASNLRVNVAIDNDVQVFINGQDISGGLQIHEGCPSRDSFVFTAPDGILTTGTNLLAVRGRDRGVLSYLDVQVMADITLIGDVSNDDNVTAYDASLALQYVVGLIELSLNEQAAADVTGDKTVSALDAALILQYCVGLITEFPREQASIAPSMYLKLQDKPLVEIIEQLESVSLNTEQRKVLEQLKRLISQQLPPKHTTLLQNYPNPFNPDTWIPFKLAQNAPVTISIYNTKGQLVRILHIGTKGAGVYVTKDRAGYWDGMDYFGQRVSSGIYYYTLQAGTFKATRKMLIVK